VITSNKKPEFNAYHFQNKLKNATEKGKKAKLVVKKEIAKTTKTCIIDASKI
jgi:hypothetical protein